MSHTHTHTYVATSQVDAYCFCRESTHVLHGSILYHTEYANYTLSDKCHASRYPARCSVHLAPSDSPENPTRRCPVAKEKTAPCELVHTPQPWPILGAHEMSMLRRHLRPVPMLAAGGPRRLCPSAKHTQHLHPTNLSPPPIPGEDWSKQTILFTMTAPSHPGCSPGGFSVFKEKRLCCYWSEAVEVKQKIWSSSSKAVCTTFLQKRAKKGNPTEIPLPWQLHRGGRRGTRIGVVDRDDRIQRKPRYSVLLTNKTWARETGLSGQGQRGKKREDFLLSICHLIVRPTRWPINLSIGPERGRGSVLPT